MPFAPNPPIVSSEVRGWQTTISYADGTTDTIPNEFARDSGPAPGVLRIAYRNSVVRRAREQGSSYRFPWEFA